MIQRNSSPPASIIGVCPVVETPFHDSGDSDASALGELVEHLARIGAASVMYAGFASEMHKLRDEERDELTNLVIARGHARGISVVASVSDASTDAAAARAARYAAWGADFVNILPPMEAASDPRAASAHVRAVLAAVHPAPVILQLAPGSVLDVAAVAGVAEAAPNLVQVKVETRPASSFIAGLGEAAPRLTCLVGSAGVDLPAAVRGGAVGVQPGCSAAEIYLRYWRLWSAGDSASADALHARLRPYITYWMQDVELIVAAEKRISHLRGLIPTDVCRDPARHLTREELAMVDRFLEEFEVELRTAHHSANEPSA